jgi:hypothetical protein
MMYRSLNLALYLIGSIRVPGKNEEHPTAFLEGLNDRLCVIHPRQNIARRYPTTDPGRFERRTCGIRSELVIDRVTYEYINGHLMSQTRFVALIAAFFTSSV